MAIERSRTTQPAHGEDAWARRGADANRTEPMEERLALTPAVDIYENQEELRIVADVPGAETSDVHISFEKDRLSLRATRTAGFDASAEPVEYRREFLVPRGIDVERIEARVEAGVLSVRLPKAASLKPRQIPVRAG